MKTSTGFFQNICLVCGYAGLGALGLVTVGVLAWVAFM